MAKKKEENFLDYIPRHNVLYPYEEKGGHVEVLVENKGFFNKIAQTLFKKPRHSRIELDEFGSFVWKQMDGEKSVYEIGKAVSARFGKKAEPLYERLSRFVKVLHDNHFVVYVNKLDDKKKADH